MTGEHEPVKGFCESIRTGPRFVTVGGWASREALAPGARLVVRCGDTVVASGSPGIAREREDLTALGAAAFAATLRGTVPAGAGVAVELHAGDASIAMRTVAADGIVVVAPRGHIDQVDQARLRGWVVDPACWLLGVPPRLIVGTLAIDLPLNERRDDLGDPAPLEALLGFSYDWNWIVAQLRGRDPGFVLGSNAVALESSDVEVARVRYVHRVAVRGRIERVAGGQLAGWAVDADRAHEAVALDLMVDGVRYESGAATRDRADLRDKGIAPVGGGFRLPVPEAAPGEEPGMAVTVQVGMTAERLDGDPIALADVPPRCRDRSAITQTLPSKPRGIAIVVPIHRAAEDLERCIDALRRHTSRSARLILIDDASHDPAIDAILTGAAAWPSVEVHVNPVNLGFTATCNRGIALAGRDDVVLLNSDTMVTPGWLQGLHVAAYSEPGVASATPLSDNAGAFSVPEHNAANSFPAGLDHDAVARSIRQESRALMPAMPTGNGFCLYMRRDALDRIGDLDQAAFPRGYGEENDWCMRAWRSGLVNLVDDRSYVHHRRSVSFGPEKDLNMAAGRLVVDERYPEYRLLTRQFRDDPDMRAIRWRIRRAIGAIVAPPRPRILFVISTTSGGTPQTNGDLMAALSDRYEPWVLRCDTRMLELSRWTPDGVEPVERHRLERPIHAAVHRSAEYDGRVADLLVRFGFELVHIRHIAWHGLGLPEVCRRLGIPTVFSFHDFYTVCPTTKLLDERRRFCGGRCTAGEGACTPELWPQGTIPPLKHRFVDRWREMMAPMIDACDAFVTTSPGARDTIIASYQQLATRDFRVIPHARDFAHMESLAALPNSAERLRVLVPGNISVAKGAMLITAVAALDTAHRVEFHILGDPGQVPAGPNVIHHGRYDRIDFADAVRRIRPHVGAILSIWPETYSHTLTEMWAAGLPVVALDTGAVGERIAETNGGWLLDPAITPAGLLDRLLAIRGDRRGIRQRSGSVADWQIRTGRSYDTAAMSTRYDQLYRSVAARRLAFLPAPTVEVPVVLTHAGVDTPGLYASLRRRTANAAGRSVVYRPAPEDLAWNDAALDGVDAVLVSLEAVRPHQLPALLARVARDAIPLIVVADTNELDTLTLEQWSLLRAARLVLVADARAVGSLQRKNIAAVALERRIDGLSWRREGQVARPFGDLPPRLLVVGACDEAAVRDKGFTLITDPECIPDPRTSDVASMRALLGHADVVAIGDSDAASALAWTKLCQVMGVAHVHLSGAGATADLAALAADPLALDRAALAAWRSLPPEAWLPTRDDPLDDRLVEVVRAARRRRSDKPLTTAAAA